MKKLLFILLLFPSVVFAQWNRQQIFNVINSEIRLKTASQTRLAGVIDSLNKSVLIRSSNLSDLTNAGTARTNLGATTVGGNLFTLPDPSAVRFIQLNANNTVSALNASDFRTAIGAGSGTGTVSNISTSAPLTGGPVTTVGTIGITQSTTSTDGYLSSTDWNTFNNKVPSTRSISTTSPLTGGGDLSANRTFAINNAAADESTKGAATFTAADFNASSGLISIDYTNGQAASGSTKGFLTSTDWTTFNNKGTVTDFSVVTANGISASVANSTTTPAATFTLGAITPSSVAAVGTVTGSNLSGNNTGDQTNITGNAGTATALQTPRTIGTITGDATSAGSLFDGSANNTNALTLAYIISAGGPTGSATVAPIITYDAKGRLTAVSSATITPAVGSITGLGTSVATALVVNVGSAGAFVVNGGALGTPSSGVATNLTGTAASLTAGSATILTNTRTLWGQNFNGSANVTGSLTSVGDITGGASDMNIIAGTGASRILNLKSTTSGSTVTTGLSIGATQLITLPAYTTNGGLLYTNGSGVISQTGAGTSTTVLHGGTSPSYSAVSMTADITGITPLANGGTATSTVFTQGSIIFAGASGIYTQDNGNLFFDDTNNKVLFGNTTAISAGGRLARVEIIGTDAASSNLSILRFSTGTNPSVLSMGKSQSGVVGSYVALADGVQIAQIEFPIDDGTDLDGTGANIIALVDGTVSSNVTPGALSFRTTGAGSQTPTERIRINSNGALGIASDFGTVGQVPISNGLGAAFAWSSTPTLVGTNFSGVPYSALSGTVPFWSLASGGTLTGNNTITGSSSNRLTINFATLGANSGVTINSSGTDILTGGSAISASQTGVNASSSQITNSIYGTNTRTGSGTNIGIRGNASGGTRNIAGLFESGDLVSYTKLIVNPTGDTYATVASNSETGPGVYVRRTISGGGVNEHGFIDGTTFANSTFAYNSFDAQAKFGTSGTYDHYAAFQSRGTNVSGVTLTNYYSLYSTPTLVSGSTTTTAYGLYHDYSAVTGTVTNSYGVYIGSLGGGSTAYSFYGLSDRMFNGGATVFGTGGAFVAGRALAISGSAPLFAIQVSGTERLLNGAAGSNDAFIVGTLTGDSGWKTTNQSILWSNDAGTTAHMKLSATGSLLLKPAVTTGSGSTAGAQFLGNSLTTGNLIDASSSSVTTGNLAKFTSTSTVVNHVAGTNAHVTISSSGANSTSSKTTVGFQSLVTNTGTTSENDAVVLSSSGATTNFALKVLSGDVRIGTGATASQLQFGEPSGSGTNITTFKAQAQSADINYTLPATDASGFMKSDGSGGLSWSTTGTLSGLTSGRIAVSSSATAIVDYDGLQYSDVSNRVTVKGSSPGYILQQTSRTTNIIGNSTGLNITNNTDNSSIEYSAGNYNRFTIEDANNSSTPDNAIFAHRITGSPSIGFGSGIALVPVLSDGSLIGGVKLKAVTTSVGSTTEDVDFVVETSVDRSSAEMLRVTSDGRLHGKALHNNAGAVTGTTNQYIASGTYTPTLTNVTNIAASTAYACQWMRVGNVVTVSGQVDIDATLSASTATELGISLPIASALSANEQVGGDAISDVVASLSARIKADATNDRASVVFKAISLSNDTYSFTFTYLIL